ncbi:MAG: hypothetical protein CVT92_05960 [Bacteroidetes bacterium HGW-Bacteroidetes-1]|jgi:hypothetical protein|nr:MAG: hypothetical protein CVT92_05960 [Bacteroidetes bacterium HGW-Bacteroidetes-1]
MKKAGKLIIVISMIVVYSGCTEKYKKEIDRLTVYADSIKTVSFEKDTISMSYVKTFNAIQQNLEEIKMKERLINQLSETTPENRKSKEDEINSDIDAIYELLLKNKQMVEDLKKQLKSSGVKNSELDLMIVNLNSQIETKDAEISLLKEDLSNKKLVIKNLETNLVALEKLGREKEVVIEKQTIEKNKVWYIVGNKKYLEEKNVVVKEGGFIGIGKSSKVGDDFDKSLFTPADQRDLRALPVFSKKARLLSIHPAASYQFTGENSIDSLIIIHSDDFWSASRYLVVMID